MENRPLPRRQMDDTSERPAKPYDPETGRYLDGPHPDEPDNNSASAPEGRASTEREGSR